MGLLNFFDRFRAGSDDRSAGGDFWFEPASLRSVSGLRVSPERALRLSAVYACVRILAETMASLPLVVYRNRANSGKNCGKDRVTDHWLHTVLCRRPNRYQNPFEWREMLQGHLALRGNAYNQIITNPRGEIVELVPIHPDRVRIELLRSGEHRYRVTDRFGEDTVLPRGEVWHLRGLSSDGLIGMSPIDLARESLGIALAAQDYGTRFFANDAKPTGGWIEFPGSFKDTEAKKVFRESYQQAQSGANRGKVLVLENGMKFHEVGVTNKDAQFLELRKFQITVMILSPKAGGVGITLTAANHVIHLSRWWNPAVEDQCSDRAYRIGQTKDVHIYYPMAINPSDPETSFDIKLNELMARKRQLSQQLLEPPTITKQDYEFLLSQVKG